VEVDDVGSINSGIAELGTGRRECSIGRVKGAITEVILNIDGVCTLRIDAPGGGRKPEEASDPPNNTDARVST
jgi:hypothetical protein